MVQYVYLAQYRVTMDFKQSFFGKEANFLDKNTTSYNQAKLYTVI